MTLLWVFWGLSWRRRVKPRTFHEHDDGSGHDLVVVSSAYQYCADCTWTSSYCPPISAVGWLITATLVIYTVSVLWVGNLILGVIL